MIFLIKLLFFKHWEKNYDYKFKFRVVIWCNSGSDGYITKFPLNLISQHPDFTSSSGIMSVLSSGSYDVIADTVMPTLTSSSP